MCAREIKKLELTWAGKDAQTSPEPRILLEQKDKSYGDQYTENMLIHGDNLLALKSLESDFTGKVKCIYIDPPYNTKSTGWVYPDGYEHSIWLSLMRDRLEILRNLLTEDGSIYINIDFNEAHYLKILMDEVFGRDCFQREIIWRIGWLSGFKTIAPNYIRNHDTILFYTKSPTGYYFDKQSAYNYRDDFQERFNDASYKELLNDLKTLGVKEKEAKDFLDKAAVIGLPERYPLEDTWNCSVYDKLNSIAVVSFSGEKVSKMLGVEEFKGQKSEKLIQRILSISTKPGDLVLDSFLGTGTTAAVAHKMGRRWIGIELGEHAYSNCIPRLKKVVDGTDTSGISKVLNWQGGGGFKFYELASSLIVKDGRGFDVISKEYNGDMLAEAMCKIMGYKYRPDKAVFWKQGKGTEKNWLFTTTMTLTEDYLEEIHAELGDESLLVCCGGFTGRKNAFNNITIKKIPKAILEKCEWNKPGYPLPVREDFTEKDFEIEGDE